jgi:4,5-DOPA dioxygenase extradiol
MEHLNTPSLPLVAPSLYISHGSPMTALEPGAAGAFWTRLGPVITQTFGRPRAILAISAHSLTREPVLLAGAQQHAVYDFGGFPPELYQLQYAPPGAPALATTVQGLLQAAGIPVHRLDQGGLDHGIWTPQRSMYPQADIPVLPLAWNPRSSTADLFRLGQALAPLREQGVLVMGTGSITHNLSLFPMGPREIDLPELPACAAFRAWFAERVAVADWPALLDYRRQAPSATHMHPSDEHLLPWYVAAGTAGPAPVGVRLHESVTYGHLGMDAYAFGNTALALQAALAAG